MTELIRARLRRLRHVLGTGRAIDNARRDHDQTERSLAAVEILEARFTPTKAA